MIANLFVSTFLSLKAHKLRVFLTMVGIIIGITSVVTISALGEGMKRQVVKASSAVNADVLKIHYTMSDGSSDNFMSYEEPDYTFSRVDLKKLQDIQGIESIYPQYGESMMGGGDNLFVPMDYFGAQANLSITSTKGQNDILYGRDFQPSDANTDAIVLNHDIFEAQIRLDDPSQLIGKAVSIGGYMYKVIGILAPMARRIPISRFRSVTDTYMMFMTPIPPTNREIAVIAIRNIVIPVTISSICCWSCWSWSFSLNVPFTSG